VTSETLNPTTSLHVLVADDDPVMRNVLGNFLKSEGHTVVLAENGARALSCFEQDQEFDLFVLDVRMPEVDGLSVCSRLKGRLTRWVPIMMISANSEERSQVEGLDIGADYYLTKPVSFALLRAYVRAAQRAVTLQNELQEKKQRLEDYYNQSRADNDLARQLLDRLLHSSEVMTVDSKIVVDPAGEFSGDLILSMRSPSQRFYSLVADATGHGLPAAITLIPVVETFSRLAREGYSVETIARELNTRLRANLPRDRFVAAAIMMFEPHTERLEVWNGGCPTVYLMEESDRHIVEKFPASHPPLGILDTPHFDAGISGAAFKPSQTIVACTDGIIESENSRGELFGKSGMEAVLESRERAGDLVHAIGRALMDFGVTGAASDDRSLLVLPLATLATQGANSEVLGAEGGVHQESDKTTELASKATGGWYISLGLRGDTLRDTELAPIVNSLISRMGVQGANADKAHVCITELLNNAIDHGVLGLDSSLKSEPEGFQQYFEERQKRLSALRKGGIFVRANLDRSGADYVLTITVSDSGEGFIAGASEQMQGEATAIPSGRGIQLVRRLSDRLSFHDDGATAEFQLVSSQGLSAHHSNIEN
jgi:CheY-like chemotaxis protein